MNRASLNLDTSLHEQNHHSSPPAFPGQAIRSIESKIVFIKRILFFGVSFLLIAWFTSSCEDLGNCQSCKWVTTDSSNGEVTEAPGETEYCGAELLAIKIKSTTTGTRTTVYKCH